MTLPSVPEAPKKRRHYTAEFKARIVADCQQPDTSIARIAQDHGLNANLLHKWIRMARQRTAESTPPAFLPIPLSRPPEQQAESSLADSIRIEIPRPRGAVVVSWPVADAERCLRWLQELLR